MCVVVKDQRKKFKKVVRFLLELVPRALDDKEVEAVISKLFSEICKFGLTKTPHSDLMLPSGESHAELSTDFLLMVSLT